MEHIGNALGSYQTGEVTPNPKIYNPEPEMTEQEKAEQLRKSLGLSSLGNTFDNFKPTPGTEKALATFKALASGDTTWKMLLCFGGVGNGKTHLCEATVIELYRHGLFCRIMPMDRMMATLKETMRSGSHNSIEDILWNYCNAERLIIDDVEGTEWEFEQLEKIIRSRYRENLFTILTTNRDIAELPERILSRFRDRERGRLVLNEAVDYRPKKAID